MSIYDTEFSRRLRSSVPPSPGSPSRYHNPKPDVFGDITLPLRNASPQVPSPVSARKGKGVVRDYGDRWVDPFDEPYTQRWVVDENADSFQLEMDLIYMQRINYCPRWML